MNTSGVLFTAQAAGRQMAKYNCPGSIILIASMSGSITNKVSTLDPYMKQSELTTSVLRIMHGYLITQVNLPYFRWPVAWLVSWERRTLESTVSRLGIYTPSTVFPYH